MQQTKRRDQPCLKPAACRCSIIKLLSKLEDLGNGNQIHPERTQGQSNTMLDRNQTWETHKRRDTVKGYRPGQYIWEVAGDVIDHDPKDHIGSRVYDRSILSKSLTQSDSDSIGEAIPDSNKATIDETKIEWAIKNRENLKPSMGKKKLDQSTTFQSVVGQCHPFWNTASADSIRYNGEQNGGVSAKAVPSDTRLLVKEYIVDAARGAKKENEMAGEDSDGVNDEGVNSQQVDCRYEHHRELAEVAAKGSHPFWDSVNADPMK